MAKIRDIQLKAEWADEHIKQLDLAVRAFNAFVYEKRNEFIGTENYPETGKERFYVKTVPVVPSDISLIAADTLGNLRSALDHLAYGIAEKANPSLVATKPEQILFPYSQESR